MIRPSDLINYMRDNRTNPIWSIEYASTYLTATDKSKLKLPCFYVDLNSVNGLVESDGEYLQSFTANIRVRLVCLNRGDRMGRIGADVAYNARLELFRILLFKKIDDRFNEIYFLGDAFEAIDEARYIHTFDFTFAGVLDSRYLVEPNFDELRAIDVKYDLVDSPESEYPNAEEIINTFQD